MTNNAGLHNNAGQRAPGIPTVTFLTASKAEGQQLLTQVPAKPNPQSLTSQSSTQASNESKLEKQRLPAGYTVCRNPEYNSPYIGFGRQSEFHHRFDEAPQAAATLMPGREEIIW